MNKLIKILVAVLGSFDLIFSMFMPIAIVFLVINSFTLSRYSLILLILTGLFSTLYRWMIILINAFQKNIEE